MGSRKGNTQRGEKALWARPHHRPEDKVIEKCFKNSRQEGRPGGNGMAGSANQDQGRGALWVAESKQHGGGATHRNADYAHTIDAQSIQEASIGIGLLGRISILGHGTPQESKTRWRHPTKVAADQSGEIRSLVVPTACSMHDQQGTPLPNSAYWMGPQAVSILLLPREIRW